MRNLRVAAAEAAAAAAVGKGDDAEGIRRTRQLPLQQRSTGRNGDLVAAQSGPHQCSPSGSLFRFGTIPLVRLVQRFPCVGFVVANQDVELLCKRGAKVMARAFTVGLITHSDPALDP